MGRLPKVSAEDLKDLGVVLGGHRRRLLDAIAALGAAVPAASATAAPRDAPAPAEAERRQLTVMFCDLVGSTALSARLDPEDLREIIAAYHRAVAEVVAEFDGFVAKYMGDGASGACRDLCSRVMPRTSALQGFACTGEYRLTPSLPTSIRMLLYLSSQTSSMRLPLKRLSTMIVSPLT